VGKPQDTEGAECPEDDTHLKYRQRMTQNVGNLRLHPASSLDTIQCVCHLPEFVVSIFYPIIEMKWMTSFQVFGSVYLSF
jgi:hypothetical protein